MNDDTYTITLCRGDLIALALAAQDRADKCKGFAFASECNGDRAYWLDKLAQCERLEQALMQAPSDELMALRQQPEGVKCRVPGAWLASCGYGDEDRVFEVTRLDRHGKGRTFAHVVRDGRPWTVWVEGRDCTLYGAE